MKCHFCKIEMIESDELCWKVGEPITQETGEVYSKRYTCPKCWHLERDNFQLKQGENNV